MGNAHAFINGRQYPRADVSVVIDHVACELEIDGLDYTEAAEVSLHLSAAGEERLISLLGRSHFERSFDIHVSFAASAAAPVTEDRLIDCRLRVTGRSPLQVSVMFVEHGPELEASRTGGR